MILELWEITPRTYCVIPLLYKYSGEPTKQRLYLKRERRCSEGRVVSTLRDRVGKRGKAPDRVRHGDVIWTEAEQERNVWSHCNQEESARM